MAKFCKYCGTPLEEGQVCSCPQAQAEAGAGAGPAQPTGAPQQGYVPPQQGYVPPQQPQQPQQPSQVGSAFKNVLPFLKAYFRAPVSATRSALGQRDLVLSLVLLAIQAVVGGLVVFSMLSKACSWILDMTMGGYRGGPSVHPSLPMSLVSGILIAILAIVVFAVVILVVAKIMKSTCSFQDVLIACGANSLPVTVLLLISFILFFLSGRLGLVILFAAMIAWMAMGVPTVQALIATSDHGKFWMSYIVGVLIAVLLGSWLASKCMGIGIKAITISEGGRGGESYTIGEIMEEMGNLDFDDLIEEAIDNMF